jgi:dCMP deaminase
MSMLDVIASRSKDKHTKVGCVVVGPDNEIRSTGYNSLPSGVDDSRSERFERPEKYKWFEHADRNAIYNAARMGVSLNNCRMYLPFFPCIECTRGIIQVGINEVIIDQNKVEERMVINDSIYNEQNKISEEMLNEAGVKLTRFRAN